MEVRQYQSEHYPSSKDRIFNMKMVYDGNLAEDEWELRWDE